MKKYLQQIYSWGADHKRAIITGLILFLIILLFSNDPKKILSISAAIFFGSVSKLYHRVYKTSLGFDLIFISSIILARSYDPITVIVTCTTALLLADFFATKISYYSLVTIIGLVITIVCSWLLTSVSLLYAGMIVLLVFESITALLYSRLGSSWSKIAVFVSSHFIFNMTLISMLA